MKIAKKIYSYRTNALKFRILFVLISAKKPLTTLQMEELTGIARTRLSAALYHYQHIKKQNGKEIELPYIKRLPKKVGNEYRYVITKKGEDAYKEYVKRIQSGISLNRVRPRRNMSTFGKWDIKENNYDVSYRMLEPYIGISAYGKKQEVTPMLAFYLEAKNKEKAKARRIEKAKAVGEAKKAKKAKAREEAAIAAKIIEIKAKERIKAARRRKAIKMLAKEAEKCVS